MPVKMSACLPSPKLLRSLCAACAAACALALSCGPAGAATDKPAPTLAQPGPLANFHGTPASAGVREVANWAFYTRDNQGRAVVILDKKEATVYAFTPDGLLMASAPALLGMAVGDGTVAGVGDKPLSQVPEDERTTPAGRFVAEPGVDDTGVDVVWVDYESAVAMHRVITTFPEQHRPERLASPDPRIRRISYGCINLPIPFYEQVISPTVRGTGAIVYVLPETKSPREVFGSWDVTDPNARPPAVASKHPGASDSAAPRPPQHLHEPQALRTSGSTADL
jgi:hypothetical protein